MIVYGVDGSNGCDGGGGGIGDSDSDDGGGNEIGGVFENET